jgi:hypothetical protein
MKRALKKYCILLLSIIMAAGCTDFDELNKDPNSSSFIDPDLMIPTIQYLPGANWQEWQRYFIYPGGFMNQWTGSWAVVEYGGCGQKHSSYQERLWTSDYPQVIKHVVDLVERTKSDPSKINIHSMARIMKVQSFLRLTDYYGDIPYSEAGRGYYDANLNPGYDTQEFIYNDFLKELKEAAQSFDPSYPIAKYDLFYNGNIEQWKKYANTLRLRIAMRLIKVDPAKAKSEAEDAIAMGVFSSNDDICYVKYENIQNPAGGIGKGNGIANYVYGTNAAVGGVAWITTELVEVMEEMNDPRLLKGYYAQVLMNDVARTDVTELVRAQRNSYAAMTCQAQKYSYDENTKYNVGGGVTITVNGQNVTLSLAHSRLRASKYVEAFDAPFIYITYAEAEFLTAEAAARGWNVEGGAAEHYKNGLEAAVRQWTLFGAPVTETEVTDFSAANPLMPGYELEQINTQLWVLHFLDPIESWSNYRRSGLPNIIFYNYIPAKNQSDGIMPRRMVYPIEEQTRNKANYDEAVSRMNGSDSWTNRVWWDK